MSKFNAPEMGWEPKPWPSDEWKEVKIQSFQPVIELTVRNMRLICQTEDGMWHIITARKP